MLSDCFRLSQKYNKMGVRVCRDTILLLICTLFLFHPEITYIPLMKTKHTAMERTWRWFGRKDAVTLDMLRQIGVQGIVTALHDVPNGHVWTDSAVADMKNYIESHGLRWSVVESLPVCEEIKYGGPGRDRLIDNYVESLSSLGRNGIRTVCYNFMPVIDWIRTDLAYGCPDGTTTLRFDWAEFAYFDCRILCREGAEKDYGPELMAKVEALDRVMTQEDRDRLVDTIIVKTQGFIDGNIKEGEKAPVAVFRKLLSLYSGIDRDALRANLKYFLERIMPVCDKYGIDMCIHPDDPPFQVLGLPRIVTCEEDIDWLLSAVPDSHNGLTFCAGSLSSGRHNDVPAMARKFVDRTYFVHLRSTEVDAEGNFMEASHLAGRARLKELVPLFAGQERNIPYRVDHGRCMLGDASRPYNPGYTFLGRMYALAQVMGMEAMVE